MAGVMQEGMRQSGIEQSTLLQLRRLGTIHGFNSLESISRSSDKISTEICSESYFSKGIWRAVDPSQAMKFCRRYLHPRDEVDRSQITASTAAKFSTVEMLDGSNLIELLVRRNPTSSFSSSTSLQQFRLFLWSKST